MSSGITGLPPGTVNILNDYGIDASTLNQIPKDQFKALLPPSKYSGGGGGGAPILKAPKNMSDKEKTENEEAVTNMITSLLGGDYGDSIRNLGVVAGAERNQSLSDTFETAKTASKNALKQVTKEGHERIQKLLDAFKKMAHAAKAGKFANIFGWVGAVAGLIAGIAVMAVAGWTGVGAVAGACIVAASAIALGQKFAELSPKAKEWMQNNPAFGYAMMGVQILLAVASLGLTVGPALLNVATSAASIAVEAASATIKAVAEAIMESLQSLAESSEAVVEEAVEETAELTEATAGTTTKTVELTEDVTEVTEKTTEIGSKAGDAASKSSSGDAGDVGDAGDAGNAEDVGDTEGSDADDVDDDEESLEKAKEISKSAKRWQMGASGMHAVSQIGDGSVGIYSDVETGEANQDQADA